MHYSFISALKGRLREQTRAINVGTNYVMSRNKKSHFYGYKKCSYCKGISRNAN